MAVLLTTNGAPPGQIPAVNDFRELAGPQPPSGSNTADRCDTYRTNHPFTLRERLTTHHHTTLLWKDEAERSEKLVLEFARRGVPQQLIRWTGWHANIGKYSAYLPELAQGFEGVKGFHLSGGTRMYDLDTGVVLPSICEVPAALNRVDNELVLIGLIPKVDEAPHLERDYGIILRVDAERGRFTTVHPDQDIGVVLQKGVNGVSDRIEEAKESFRLAHRLAELNWNTTLVVFGGTPSQPSDRKLSRVEQEVVWWANAAKEGRAGATNILLIRGSGGVADALASNAEWLRENRSVRVADLTKESIQMELQKLGLVTS